MELKFSVWQRPDGFAIFSDIADQQNTRVEFGVRSGVGLARSTEICGEPNLVFNAQIIVSKNQQASVDPNFAEGYDSLRR